MPADLHDRLEQIGRELRDEIRPIVPADLDLDRHRSAPAAASPVILEPAGHARRPRRWALTVAMAAVVAAVIAGLAATNRSAPPEPAASNSPAARAVAPVAVDPPAWVGTVLPGVRADDRRGGWTAAAIGQPTANGGVANPIAITSFDQADPAPGPATPITIDGTALRLVEVDDWQALLTLESPTVMVSGRTDRTTLAAVLRAVSTGEDTFELGELPDGYTILVPPTVLGEPADRRRRLPDSTVECRSATSRTGSIRCCRLR